MRFRLISLALFLSSALAQPPTITQYIHTSWDTLTRTQTSCATLTDPKVIASPVLYLPAGMNVPPEIKRLEKECDLQIDHLPRKIKTAGDVDPTRLRPGLLYLPSPYVVPGGRFNEMYGWDSYFILLGLVRDKPQAKLELAYGMLDNFFFELDNYGSILNANRTYYLTRSQPPFLAGMIREVYEHDPKADPHWLAQAYDYAVRDHNFWIKPIHLAGATGLARYVDLGSGPVPEMDDDSTYYPDVIRWLIAHPGPEAEDYLLETPGNPNAEEVATIAKSSCNILTSKVCANAHVLTGGVDHRLTAAFFHGDRAMRESGFDTSFRFGPFSAATEDYAPVCLNSLLYRYELDLAHIADLLHKPVESAQWLSAAAVRKAAIDKYLWNPAAGLYFDYNFAEGTRSHYRSLATFYPLWAGAASDTQAGIVARHLPDFEHPGGLAMSTTDSGTQWDLPYGWAPTTWLTVEGLERYHQDAPARRIAREFSTTIEQNFARDRTIREKYNVVDGSANIAVAAGYKENVIGFGWTNAVYLMLQSLIGTR